MTLYRDRGIAARIVLIASFCVASVCAMAAVPPNLPTPPAPVDPRDAYGRLPIVFEGNHGQVDPQAKYLARGPGYSFFLTQDGAILSLSRSGQIVPKAGAKSSGDHAALVAMTFIGANKNAVLSGERDLASQSHYFKGRNGAQEQITSQHYAAVRQSAIYPGIDAVYYGNQQQLEYDLIVAPGANPDVIHLAYRGVEKISVDENGVLVLQTEAGNLVQQAPVIYQSIGAERKLIEGAYSLRGNEVGFTIGVYDKNLPLVIDPVLSYSTFVGGDGATAVAVDASGNAYITGWVSSLGFPLVNAFDSTINITKAGKTDTDAFVSKLNASGTALVYSTYLGGNIGVDRASAIAIDASGNAYVTGSTTGSDFPTTAGAYQVGRTGGGAFVAKLGPAGNTLIYSTYVASVQASTIAVDASGSAYLGGNVTLSDQFVPTPGAIQGGTQGIGPHAFVIKFNATGTAAAYAGYFGGSGTDKIKGIAIDSIGNAYVAGSTTSTDFPAVNAYQPTSAGGMDGFVAKINSAGSALIYSTYLGAISMTMQLPLLSTPPVAPM